WSSDVCSSDLDLALTLLILVEMYCGICIVSKTSILLKIQRPFILQSIDLMRLQAHGLKEPIPCDGTPRLGGRFWMARATGPATGTRLQETHWVSATEMYAPTIFGVIKYGLMKTTAGTKHLMYAGLPTTGLKWGMRLLKSLIAEPDHPNLDNH